MHPSRSESPCKPGAQADSTEASTGPLETGETHEETSETARSVRVPAVSGESRSLEPQTAEQEMWAYYLTEQAKRPRADRRGVGPNSLNEKRRTESPAPIT